MSLSDSQPTSDYAIIDDRLELQGRFVVDAGCGSLKLARHLSERGASVLAVDPDPVQAKKNRAAEVIPNVGFVESSADAIPVETGGTDGVIFSYSLHHIPTAMLPRVFDEVFRILKPEGFLYVLEPVADGALYDVMKLFHNETQIRAEAQTALDSLVQHRFKQAEDFSYYRRQSYTGWEEFANHYAGLSYNAGYTEAQVRDEQVQRRFESLGAPLGYAFEVPMRVRYFTGVKSTPA